MKNEPVNQEYLDNLRRAWRERAKQKKEDMEKLRRSAYDKAIAAAGHLKKKYNVSAVYLYGSLALTGLTVSVVPLTCINDNDILSIYHIKVVI